MLFKKENRLLLLHGHGNRRPVPARLCRLDMSDYDDAMDLHARVYNEVANEDIYASENSIGRNLSGEGFALGVRAAGLLVAMCVFSWVMEDMLKVLEGTYMETWPMESFAMRDIVVVDGIYRGNGLHRMLIEASGTFLPSRRRYVVSTVAPGNWPSLRNVLAEGYYVVACKKLYGGHDRFITWQDLDDPMVISRPVGHLRIPVGDVACHGQALAMGAVGYELERSDGGPVLRYGKGVRRSRSMPAFFGGEDSYAG